MKDSPSRITHNHGTPCPWTSLRGPNRGCAAFQAFPTGSSVRHDVAMDEPLRGYIESIDPEHRPLFDRIERLIFDSFPEATVTLSYRMPTYKVGPHRLYLGVWKHGVSIYGWGQGRAVGFISRHPSLKTSKGTIQLRPDDAAGITDDELRELVRAALGD